MHRSQKKFEESLHLTKHVYTTFNKLSLFTVNTFTFFRNFYCQNWKRPIKIFFCIYFEKIKILDIFWYTSWGIFAVNNSKINKIHNNFYWNCTKKSLTGIGNKYKNMYIRFSYVLANIFFSTSYIQQFSRYRLHKIISI